MKTTLQRFILWVNILWALTIFILCVLPKERFPDMSGLHIPHLDKFVHGGMFFLMSMLICFYYSKKSLSRRAGCVLAGLFSLVYGGLIELLQHYFFHRGGDVWDLMADVAGGLCGCWFYHILRSKYPEL